MTCIFGDQPERVRITSTGVVHAAAYKAIGEECREPKNEKLKLACRRKFGINLGEHVVSNNTPITCKHCLKIMGLSDEKEMERYVVYNKKTNEFLSSRKLISSTGSSCQAEWSKDIDNAFLFRDKENAEKECSDIYYRIGDSLMTYGEMMLYGWLSNNKHSFSKETVKNSDLEIKHVIIKITVIHKE